MHLAKYLFFICSLIASNPVNAQANQLGYDIIYVRYPIVDNAKKNHHQYVTIPQGEQPYEIAPGADLILLKRDGREVVLVDCEQCSVMDPYISYDGNTVYYSHIEKPKRESASWLYKINLNDPNYTPVRLTFDDGFDSNLYAGNQGKSDKHNQQFYRGIRDMAPVPLADGRLLFTSNRAGLTAFNPGTDAVVRGSIQQLYVMDDHDGSKTTAQLANIERLETGSLHMVQHPIQLMDGRILFSSWQDVGNKFRYAMTNLMLVNPDGTNLMQFTEPHDHHKFLEHFITQLSDSQVVSGLYYPSFDYGFGVLLRYPVDPDGPDFLRHPIQQISTVSEELNYQSYREFDRKGTVNLTPHTTPRDIPAPNRSGKYAMPSAAPNGDMLVAYSTGSVNHFGAVCGKNNLCEPLKSGIYLIKKATTDLVNKPEQLIKIKDDPSYNEIWPRAVLPFQAIYQQQKPKEYPEHSNESPEDPRLIRGEAAALVGSSSMYNREELDGGDIFQSKSGQRERHDGNWLIQGAEAGVFTNSDIYAVRLVTTPAKPYTQPLSKYDENKSIRKQILPYLEDQRLDRVVARYSSFHGERWEILGEFPLTYKDQQDPSGQPDSSWVAKIPAETPFLIQAIDKKGMTLISELTWRALKPGEKRVDCGGCHAHSIEPLDFNETAAGRQLAIKNVKGISDNDVKIKQSIWDLTQNQIPLITNDGNVDFITGSHFGVEFKRDILPLLNRECISCHNGNKNGARPNLESSPDNDPYLALTRGRNDKGKAFKLPQLSRYVRSPQARQSLLVWIIYGERLDGRTNASRADDIDFPESHPLFNLSAEEKRLFARWIDLGGAIDFTPSDGFGYTEDYQLPVINLLDPQMNDPDKLEVVAGFADMGSGIDWDSLKVTLESVGSNEDTPSWNIVNRISEKLSFGKYEYEVPTPHVYVNQHKVFKFTIPLPEKSSDINYLLKIKINDKVGNTNIATRYFTPRPKKTTD